MGFAIELMLNTNQHTVRVLKICLDYFDNYSFICVFIPIKTDFPMPISYS